MSGHRITYLTLEGAAPEDEAPTLANVYELILRRYHQGKGIAAAGDPETINGTRSREVSADGTSIPEEPLLHKRNI